VTEDTNTRVLRLVAVSLILLFIVAMGWSLIPSTGWNTQPEEIQNQYSFFAGTALENADISVIFSLDETEAYHMYVMSQYGNTYQHERVVFAGILTSIPPETLETLAARGLSASNILPFRSIVAATASGEALVVTQDQNQLFAFESEPTAGSAVPTGQSSKSQTHTLSIYTHGGSADPVYVSEIRGKYTSNPNTAVCFDGMTSQGTRLIIICSPAHIVSVQ